ncbi:hypothetical protein MAUB_62490 (plasmid) [Mycolicibacterium aubagnense]|uniref:Acyl-CoA dehydrogenase/oxidase C-terminal domain-containing protein n=1 Tax=Mycolicibacterium aubagnense TaxID=319707 RepID=A0ABN5Z276_9MYCO|nr:hypothetical protein MAUB_62490 [Mycolicibacterium aubagnense]
MFFDDVRVPRSHLLGETEGHGFSQLMTQLPQERLIVAVGAVAAMELAVEQTLKYTREREAFGRPVFGFQNTKFILAEAATETRIARVFWTTASTYTSRANSTSRPSPWRNGGPLSER